MVDDSGRGPDWGRLALLWMGGFCLRATMLAIPPLLPSIHDDLHLTEKAVGALNGLPVLMLGFGAIFGSLLLSRAGAIGALFIGLVLTAVGGALRGLGPDTGMLFAMTFVMGLGIAIMQPAMPTLVGRWFPSRVGLATAVYINGLLVGEIAPVSLTLPFVLPLMNGSWEGSLAVWSLPVAVTIVAFILARRSRSLGNSRSAPGAPRVLWWPDWRNVSIWRLGLIMGFNGSIYFALNAFLPDYLNGPAGRPDLIGPVLTALNITQVPASLLLLFWPRPFVGFRWPFAVTGAVQCVAVLAMLFTSSATGIIVLAGIIGFTTSFSLILNMSLPPLYAPTGDVHRYAAGMLVIGYVTAFFLPVISGAVWDITHMPPLAFVTIAAAAAIVVLLTAGLTLPQRLSAADDAQKT